MIAESQALKLTPDPWKSPADLGLVGGVRTGLWDKGLSVWGRAERVLSPGPAARFFPASMEPAGFVQRRILRDTILRPDRKVAAVMWSPSKPLVRPDMTELPDTSLTPANQSLQLCVSLVDRWWFGFGNAPASRRAR
jgi:hypothetical protein